MKPAPAVNYRVVTRDVSQGVIITHLMPTVIYIGGRKTKQTGLSSKLSRVKREYGSTRDFR